MKSYKDITLRYFKEKKKRMFLTLVGIILSVALISGIGTILYSVRDAMVADVEDNEGSYHGILEDVKADDINLIKNNVDVEVVGVRTEVGFSPVAKMTEDDKALYGIDMPYKYLKLEEMNQASFELESIKLKEGRLPQKSNELVLDEGALKYMEGAKLGDVLNLEVGSRVPKANSKEGQYREGYEKNLSKDFKLVGIAKSKYYWSGESIWNAYLGDKGGSSQDKTSSVLVKFKDKKQAYGKLEAIAGEIESGEFSYNDRLLRLYMEGLSDTFNKSAMGLVVLIVILVVVSTVAVIYNSFNISVVEKIEEFGLLRSVGATKGQIKTLVYREGCILGLLGLPLGIISGVFAMKIVFYIVSKIGVSNQYLEYIEVGFYPRVILGSILLGILTIFLSCNGPVRKASKISPLDAIRGVDSSKVENYRQGRTPFWVSKLFKIEGEIAYKNINRNKSRFIITVFSMVISIVLFITFSNFSDMTTILGNRSMSQVEDFRIYGRLDGKDQVVKELRAMDSVDQVYDFKTLFLESKVDKDKIDKDFYKTMVDSNQISEDNSITGVLMMSIGDENLASLGKELKSGEIDPDRMDREKGALIIGNTSYRDYKTGEENYQAGAYKYREEDRVKVKMYDGDGEKGEFEEFKLVGVLNKGKFKGDYSENGAFNLIVTDKVMEDFSKGRQEVEDDLYITLKDGKSGKEVRKLEELNKKILA